MRISARGGCEICSHTFFWYWRDQRSRAPLYTEQQWNCIIITTIIIICVCATQLNSKPPPPNSNGRGNRNCWHKSFSFLYPPPPPFFFLFWCSSPPNLLHSKGNPRWIFSSSSSNDWKWVLRWRTPDIRHFYSHTHKKSRWKKRGGTRLAISKPSEW